MAESWVADPDQVWYWGADGDVRAGVRLLHLSAMLEGEASGVRRQAWQALIEAERVPWPYANVIGWQSHESADPCGYPRGIEYEVTYRFGGHYVPAAVITAAVSATRVPFFRRGRQKDDSAVWLEEIAFRREADAYLAYVDGYAALNRADRRRVRDSTDRLARATAAWKSKRCERRSG